MPRRTNVTKEENVGIVVSEENNQLSVFDYSQLSEPQIRKSLEIKGQMISVGKRVSEDLIYLAQLAKEQHDNLNSYALFINWCNKELGYSKSVAERFLRVGKNLAPNSVLTKLPDSLSSLDAIASALLKADSEEAKEEITQAINEASEEKGKALTEKEIKEITAKIKGEYEEKIKNLEGDCRLLQASKDWLDKELEAKNNTVENQNKQIEELNSDISAKENALKSLETQRADLDLLQQELKERIEKEANVIVQKTLEEERKALVKKEADLTTKEQELEKQLKQAKAIKNKAIKEKDNLTNVSDWILSLNDFNEVLKQQKSHVMATLRKIQEVPNLDVLEQSEKDIVNKKIDSVISDFHDNTEAFGMALNKVHLAIKKFDNTVLKTLGVARGKTVEVEVLND